MSIRIFRLLFIFEGLALLYLYGMNFSSIFAGWLFGISTFLFLIEENK